MIIIKISGAQGVNNYNKDCGESVIWGPYFSQKQGIWVLSEFGNPYA